VVQKFLGFWPISSLGLGLGSTGLDALVTSCLGASAVVGAVGGSTQVRARGLIGYSSIGQTGWIGLVGLNRVRAIVSYSCVYRLIILGLILRMVGVYVVELVRFSGGRAL